MEGMFLTRPVSRWKHPCKEGGGDYGVNTQGSINLKSKFFLEHLLHYHSNIRVLFARVRIVDPAFFLSVMIIHLLEHVTFCCQPIFGRVRVLSSSVQPAIRHIVSLSDKSMATEVEHLRAEGDPNNGTDEGEAPAERVIEIPLQSQELLVINLEELSDDSPAEIAELLRSERTPVKYWLAIIDEYYRRGRLDVATRLAELGLQAFKERDERDPALVQLHCLLASYALLQSRSAPRTVIPNPRQYHVKSEVKNYFTSKAAEHIAAAELLEPQSGFVLDTKGGSVQRKL